MILDTIMGYWVTDADGVMDAFLDQARNRYTWLEQALEPISAAIADLETDWTPRPADFWQRTTAALAPLRQVTKECLLLFAKEQKNGKPNLLPLIISATAMGYTGPLHSVNDKIEQAGILLTAYSDLMGDSSEQAIRQRQRVLDALRQVDEAGRKAVSAGRAKLDEAPAQQQKLTAPRQAPARPQEEPPTTTKPGTGKKGTLRPALRIVPSEEGGPQL